MNNLLQFLGVPAVLSSMVSSLAGIPQCTLFDTRGC